MNKRFESFKKALYRRDINKKELIEDLKAFYSFEEQEFILKRIPRTFDSLVYGDLFVKNESDFGKRALSYYENDEKEIGWLVHQFLKHPNEINFFLSKKKQFENTILLGDYAKSSEILAEIKQVSLSYWGLENKFLLTQYDKGLEFNFKLLNSCKTKQISDPAFYFLITFFSCKVEDDITFFNYESTLENLTSRDISPDYAEYFKFRLNPIKYDYNDFGSVFWASGKLPLFDKYLIFRAAIIKYKFYETDTDKIEFFKRQCTNIAKKIDDNLLLKMLSIDDFSLISDRNDLNIEELSIVDDFTVGKYDQVIKSAKIFLSKNINFSIVELYVKAHIHLNISIQKVSDFPCILDNIIDLVHKYCLRNEKSNESLVDLLTSALSISSFDISKEIVCFIQRNLENSESEINNFETTNSYLFSDFYNPINYQIFNNLLNQKEYLNSLSKRGSITTDFFDSILSGDESVLINFKGIIPEYRIKFYRAKYLFNSGEFELCKDEIIQLLPLVEVHYIKEYCISILFECYFNLGLNDEAINLFVDTYLTNKAIVSKIEAKKLATKIYKNNWKYISIDNISFPIFMYLVFDETHPKYIAYDLYMRSQRIDRPTELINDGVLATESQIFFLKNIANQKIISRKVTVFKNSNSVLLERISICQILARVDTNHVKEYNQEIAEITKRITVQERIKEIDQSKIYVDENGILSSELSDVKKGFVRYRTISELLKSSNMDAKGIAYEALYDLLKGNIDADTYKKSIRKSDMQYEIFVQLYKDIRDKFLFSNQYGLDYYLSQRIRHGTIINQLRKSFKGYNLVTTKSSVNGEYIKNENWRQINSDLNIEQRLNFENRLASFSSSIDEIINSLKDNYIQIKTEDSKTKQTGWFDYMFIPEWDESWLYLVFTESLQHYDDFEEFVKVIFEILWKFTESNLEHIRDNINSDIKENLISELDNLELDLKVILPAKSSSAIFRAIADCRTSVQSDVDYVVSWFNKSKNNEIDFYIDDALNTSLTIVNNINNPAELKLIQNDQEKCLIKGIYFPHFVDLIKIFLTNIHDYYKNNDMLDEYANVTISNEGEKIIIEFDNLLTEVEDLEKLKDEIKKAENDLKNINLKRIRGEGNTGFKKAYNIIQNVFRDSNNYFSFEIEKNKFKVTCNISLVNLLK
ncbi:hypothetical protein [Flavobacterium sp. TBRC 19031]|uniref:hypothetical protein n=1 Tax=Flavobacterium mekongense TaxID=3379707 RepID=UPI00399B1284